MYEGTPDFRTRPLVVDHREIQGLDPLLRSTAIRTFMKWGAEYPAKHDMSSLRLLGSVGEPINPEACSGTTRRSARTVPIVDTWWMTETGMILIHPLPGLTTTKPGSATFPFPGVKADVVDEDGKSVPLGGAGYLVLSRPWPAMLRASTRTTSVIARRTGAVIPGSTSRRRRRVATRTATSGSWAASTT